MAMGIPGRLCRNASANDGDASIAYTLRPFMTRISVMGNSAPQFKSMTAVPHGSVRAYLRTGFHTDALQTCPEIPPPCQELSSDTFISIGSVRHRTFSVLNDVIRLGAM